MIHYSQEENEMNGVYLVNYSVKGIKNLEEDVKLSFFKKTFTAKTTDFQNYNIKGIYGINGSGKTAIITSVKIFKNLIINKDYLNNPFIQSQLNELINRKLLRMDFSGDFIATYGHKPCLYHYEASVCRDKGGRIVIDREALSTRLATSRSEEMKLLYEVNNGKIVSIAATEQTYKDYLLDKTKNLLKASSVSSFVLDYIADLNDTELLPDKSVFEGLLILFLLGSNIYVYLDQTDEHADYFIDEALMDSDQVIDDEEKDNLQKAIRDLKRHRINELSVGKNTVSKMNYSNFEKRVSRLYEFISIFKRDLKNIVIDKKNDRENYVCDLIMDYGQYKVNVEFESTGIKKLIKLYEYFDEMASGRIVFIDELDSNLHDVYLCALLEYLMEYGKGQLCFTTHNIGPMDVLKRNKKSIDFLSVNHKIYSWTKNGNYSPANLYKNGMIEGSPFNIDSIDFIGVFDAEEGDQ